MISSLDFSSVMEPDNGEKALVLYDDGCVTGKPLNNFRDGFPACLRVLVVDDNPTSLLVLEKMVKHYFNEVTTCQRAEEALSMLRRNKSKFDILICDLHLPDMDGLKLLETIKLEMDDLPVVIISSDDAKEAVMKGVVHGACDFLVKPIRRETISVIWQHVVRKRRNGSNCLDRLGPIDQNVGFEQANGADEANQQSQTDNEGNDKASRRGDNCENRGSEERYEEPTGKKPRMAWTNDLHQKFVAAVNELGLEKAVPKKILECMERMNVQGLTRNNIASHLQKYRLHLQRVNELPQETPDFGRLMESNISPLEQFSSSEVLNSTISSISMPLANQCNPIIPNYSSCCFMNEFDMTNGPLLRAPYKTDPSSGIPSFIKQTVLRNPESLMQLPEPVSAVGVYEMGDDSIPELIYDASGFAKQFDHSDFLHGPLA